MRRECAKYAHYIKGIVTKITYICITMNLNSLQKSIGLINRADTVGMIAYYPLNDYKFSRVKGQPKLGAERVSRLFILS